jgi:cytochrome c556
MAGLLGLGLLWSGAAQAQKIKGKTRLAETKDLMRGINQPNCAALAKILKEGPADDKAWQQATLHASLLNEMGHVLMDDGRCPDKEWAGAAKTLRECSAKVVEASKDKDVATARTAFQKLTTACATCHKAHKS